jgi:copper chaperone
MSDAEQTYIIDGMSCEHCVAAVTAEVGALAGVSAVEVDLAGGTVLVRGGNINRDAVKAAVEEAGYSLAA